MAEPEQITRHEREIGELRGKLDGLATKDFVRQVVREQTQEIYTKLDLISAENNKKFDRISQELKALNDKQHRITGAADFLNPLCQC